MNKTYEVVYTNDNDTEQTYPYTFAVLRDYTDAVATARNLVDEGFVSTAWIE